MKSINKKPRKVMSLTNIRKINILKLKKKKVEAIVPAEDEEVMTLHLAEEEDEAIVPVYIESIQDILAQMGLKNRFLQISSNNSKASSTALTRLKNMLEYFGGVHTEEGIVNFFLNLTPTAVEAYTKYLSEIGRSPSTVYSILIGQLLFTY